ncbi:hypothetical protein D3C76_423610 [compost metagenome]
MVTIMVMVEPHHLHPETRGRCRAAMVNKGMEMVRPVVTVVRVLAEALAMGVVEAPNPGITGEAIPPVPVVT